MHWPLIQPGDPGRVARESELGHSAIVGGRGDSRDAEDRGIEGAADRHAEGVEGRGMGNVSPSPAEWGVWESVVRFSTENDFSAL